jgi:hypothetical protein
MEYARSTDSQEAQMDLAAQLLLTEDQWVRADAGEVSEFQARQSQFARLEQLRWDRQVGFARQEAARLQASRPQGRRAREAAARAARRNER